MATEFFPNTIDFLSDINVSGVLSAGSFESTDSPKWNSAYSTVLANSATAWNYQGTDLKDLSANWQAAYETVFAVSATDWNNKPEWDSVYSIVQTNSASWSAVVSYIQRFDYITEEGIDYSYAGVALNGTLETDPFWKITRLVFSDVGSLSSIAIATNVTWTERLTATYV